MNRSYPEDYQVNLEMLKGLCAIKSEKFLMLTSTKSKIFLLIAHTMLLNHKLCKNLQISPKSIFVKIFAIRIRRRKTFYNNIDDLITVWFEI